MGWGPLPADLAALELQDRYRLQALLHIFWTTAGSTGEGMEFVLIIHAKLDRGLPCSRLPEGPQPLLHGMDLAIFDSRHTSNAARAVKQGGVFWVTCAYAVPGAGRCPTVVLGPLSL